MKFLHTADWHLGKVIFDVSMIEEQKCFLKQIFNIFETAEKENKPYDALLISGDVYDRAIPNIEAVELFSNFLTELNEKFPTLHVFIISGNHDSAERLGFASEFLKKSNIHIAFDANKIAENAFELNGTVIYQIPFLMSGSFKDEKLRKQQDLFEKATKIIKEDAKKNHKNLPIVVNAHATVYGFSLDTKQVGTADSISQELFDDFSYTALGHIHKFQKLKAKMYYSGSPLAYTFDDVKDKFFLSIEIKNDKTKIEKLPIDIIHPLKRITGTFYEIYNKEDFEDYKNCYIEAICTEDFVVENPKMLLSTKYPLILSFIKNKAVASKNKSNIEEMKKILNVGKDSEIRLFEKFLSDMYDKDDENSKENKEEIELFKKQLKKINGGINNETNFS